MHSFRSGLDHPDDSRSHGLGQLGPGSRDVANIPPLPPGVSLAYQPPDSPRDWRVSTPKSPYMHCTSEMQAERPKSDSVRPVNDLLKQDNRDRFSTVNTVPLAPFPDHLKTTTEDEAKITHFHTRN